MRNGLRLHRMTAMLLAVVLTSLVAPGTAHAQLGKQLNDMQQQVIRTYESGDYATAASLGEKYCAVVRSRLGEGHPIYAIAISWLAEIYRHQDRLSEAEQLFRQALMINQRTLRPDNPELGRSYNNVASVLTEAGRPLEAEPFLRTAIALGEKALPPDDPGLAMSIHNLGGLYSVLGRHAEAERLILRARATFEKTLPATDPRRMLLLTELGLLYRDQRRYEEAGPLLEEVVSIREKTLSPTHPDLASSLHELALLYQHVGRLQDAERMLRRALDIRDKVLPATHTSVAASITNLATLYEAQGRYRESEPLKKRGLAIMEKALPPDHPQLAVLLGNLSILYAAQKDWRSALDYVRRSEDILIKRGATNVAEVQSNSGHFRMHVLFAHRAGANDAALRAESYQMAQWALLTDAAAALSQMAARQAKGQGDLAQLVRQRQDLEHQWQVVDQAISAGLASGQNAKISEARQQMTALASAYSGIDARLKRDFPDYAALVSPQPLSIADTQKLLASNEALFKIIEVWKSETTPAETYAWLVTTTDVRWVKLALGPDELVGAVQTLRCGLDATLWDDAADWPEATEEQARQKAAQIARRQRCETLTQTKPKAELLGLVPFDVLPFDAGRAHELYKALFGQVEDLIRGKHLLVVPSGPLTSLPLSVLVTEPPKTGVLTTLAGYRTIAWFGARQPITVLPSIASLKALRATASASRARQVLLGIGNPLLDGPDMRYAQLARAARARQACPEQPPAGQKVAATRGGPRTSFQSVFRGAQADIEKVRQWTPLPETADELCEIRARLGVPMGDILLGGSAREGTIKDLSASGRLAEYQILHFATHGALAGQVKGTAEPGLILTPPDQGTRDTKALDHDDGYLTASEIAGLKLDANWVILSACNTAAGANEHAEALSGLARAFFYAGARALLVSHWEVGSSTAVTLTTRAFDELGARPGIGRAEALRTSMRGLIEKGEPWQAHPSQWAPFVVVGEGGQIH